MERFTVSLSERVEEQALTAATSIRRKITGCCASSCVLNPVSAALWASPPIVLSGQVNVSSPPGGGAIFSIDPPAAAEAAIDSDQRSTQAREGAGVLCKFKAASRAAKASAGRYFQRRTFPP